MKLHLIDLTLFDGGAGASGGTGAPAAAGTTPQAGTIPGASGQRQKSGDSKPTVIYGKQPDLQNQQQAKQPENTDNSSAAESTGTKPLTKAERQAQFDKFMKEYKEEFSEHFQKTFDRRFAEMKGLEEYKQSVDPVLNTLMAKYGVNGVAELAKAIEKDDTLWEEAAEKAGMSVEAYKTLKKLERENAMKEARLQQLTREQEARQRVIRWTQEAETLMQKYPNFNLRAEIENPDFRALLEAGIPMEKVYQVVHVNDIIEGAVKITAAQTEKAVTSTIQANAQRPVENGANPGSGVIIKDDPSKLTRRELEEAIKRAQAGQIVRF